MRMRQRAVIALAVALVAIVTVSVAIIFISRSTARPLDLGPGVTMTPRAQIQRETVPTSSQTVAGIPTSIPRESSR